MKQSVLILCVFLNTLQFACNSSRFGGNKKTSDNKDSGDSVATVICVDGEDSCATLSCDELFALEAEGKINDGNRESMEAGLDECRDSGRKRGSSDDQEAIHEGSEDGDGSDDSSSASEDDDCD